MPVYDYECGSCGKVFSQTRGYPVREDPAPCECGGQADYVLVRSGIQKGTEVIRGDKRIIRDERQVTSEHGSRWRDQGTTGNPGGIGRRKFFT